MLNLCGYCLFEKDMYIFNLNFEIELDSTNVFEIYQYFGVFFNILSHLRSANKKLLDDILILIENIIVYFGDLQMPAQKFENFHLSIEIACLDCKDIEELSIRPRDFVNLEGDLTLEEKQVINQSYRSCSSCKSFIFLDYKKLFPPPQIAQIYDGIN